MLEQLELATVLTDLDRPSGSGENLNRFEIIRHLTLDLS